MLLNRNIVRLVTGVMFAITGAAALNADTAMPVQSFAGNSKTAVKTASFVLNSDCGQTASTAAPGCTTYKPCITYRGCYDCCGPTVSQVLNVKDPCDCCCNPCVAEIPVCLPACCKNASVCCKCGLFGRGIVTYSYDCGCCVTIVFRNCGDVIVKYSG